MEHQLGRVRLGDGTSVAYSTVGTGPQCVSHDQITFFGSLRQADHGREGLAAVVQWMRRPAVGYGEGAQWDVGATSGAVMNGVSQKDKKSRQRRLKSTAKAKMHQAAVLVDQARARAAAAIAPDPELVNVRVAVAKMATDPENAGPVIFTRRDTEVQIRLSQAGSDLTGNQRFVVECMTHHAGPEFFDTLNRATRAAQHSERWCAQCDGLDLVKPKVRNRERRYNKESARQED